MMNRPPRQEKPRRSRRDYRVPALLAVTAGVAVLGLLVMLLPGRGVVTAQQEQDTRPGFSDLKGVAPPDANEEAAETGPTIDPSKDPAGYQRWQRDKQAKALLKQAALAMSAKRFDEAIATLNSGLPVLKERPEAYLSMGNALLGKRDFATARDFMKAAIDRDPMFADAYFGYATASEALGELDSALGAMRTYLHTEKNRDPYRLKVAQARAAIWEWEAKLGRGEWGATKGIPPGFTADELKRDGKGVGTKMPIQGSERADGQMRYEIKSGARIEMFKP
jgi:tetratricopeptide (TPR) repeat protein